MVYETLTERVERLEKDFYFGGKPLNTEPDYQKQDDKVEQYFERARPSPKLADQTAFEEIIQRIQGCNDRVCLTADKLQKIGDRIMGALPNSGNDAVDPQRGPEGTLDHTFMALNWLDQSLSRLEQVALRMERV